jgi:hypothetical protein
MVFLSLEPGSQVVRGTKLGFYICFLVIEKIFTKGFGITLSKENIFSTLMADLSSHIYPLTLVD